MNLKNKKKFFSFHKSFSQRISPSQIFSDSLFLSCLVECLKGFDGTIYSCKLFFLSLFLPSYFLFFYLSDGVTSSCKFQTILGSTNCNKNERGIIHECVDYFLQRNIKLKFVAFQLLQEEIQDLLEVISLFLFLSLFIIFYLFIYYLLFIYYFQLVQIQSLDSKLEVVDSPPPLNVDIPGLSERQIRNYFEFENYLNTTKTNSNLYNSHRMSHHKHNQSFLFNICYVYRIILEDINNNNNNNNNSITPTTLNFVILSGIFFSFIFFLSNPLTHFKNHK